MYADTKVLLREKANLIIMVTKQISQYIIYLRLTLAKVDSIQLHTAATHRYYNIAFLVMSNSYYNEMWHLALQECTELLTKDIERQNQFMEGEAPATSALLGADDDTNSNSTLQTDTYELYIRYICISNKLEEVYDKMIQPQKAMLIRRLLDACLGRVVELKHDLVNLDLMEFNYNDAVIERLNLTPSETELRIPRYFVKERQTDIELRKQRTNEILVRLGWMKENTMKEKLTEIEAIRLIQRHERARQGRLRAHFMKEIRRVKEKRRTPEEGGKGRDEIRVLAAIKIQKFWRGYTARQKTQRRKLDEMILIGMTLPPAEMQRKIAKRKEHLNEIFSKRYQMQTICKDDFIEKLQTIYDEIKTQHGAAMVEDMTDEIRRWVRDKYTHTGKIPELPAEDRGGSQRLFSTPGTESNASPSSIRSSKESRKIRDKIKTPERSGDLNVDVGESVEEDFRPIESAFLPDIKEQIDEFNNVWRDKEEDSLSQYACEDMIYAEKFRQVQKELRKTADDIMRKELVVLQTVLGKKTKKSNKKMRRCGKKSKKKKEKDLTPDQTTEQLYEELVANSLIRQYPEIHLNQYLGDKALVARNGLKPSVGDIRQILIEYCILPLGSAAINDACPSIRSILLAGPKGSGKKTLVHAICTEVGAVLFDLTPANIVGKYPGKSGLIMLMHLILKVSRLMQPTVIYTADAERPFMKKTPKNDRTDPKRLKKDLPKLIKTIAAEDRVLFIGTTHLPWEADQKLLQQTYDRFIYIPRPDYGALSLAWKTYLNEYSAGLATIDCGTLAKVSDGYTIGDIHACIKEVLTYKRKSQIVSQPLAHVELINVLSSRDPVYREEEEAFDAWWSKTPLGRRRQRKLEHDEEVRKEELAKLTKQANGKKKVL